MYEVSETYEAYESCSWQWLLHGEVVLTVTWDPRTAPGGGGDSGRRPAQTGCGYGRPAATTRHRQPP
jgi:hypothetical protein